MIFVILVVKKFRINHKGHKGHEGKREQSISPLVLLVNLVVKEFWINHKGTKDTNGGGNTDGADISRD